MAETCAETCKECSWYEYYDGPKLTTCGYKAVMFCPKIRDDPLSTLDGYSNSLGRCGSYFTPKPKEPEKKVRCIACLNSRPRLRKPNKLCPTENYCDIKDCHFYALKERQCSDFTPKKPKEQKSCKTCRHSMYNNGTGKHCDVKGCAMTSQPDSPGWQPIEKPKEPPKPSEKPNVKPNYTFWGLMRITELQEELKDKQRDHEAHIGLLNSRLHTYLV